VVVFERHLSFVRSLQVVPHAFGEGQHDLGELAVFVLVGDAFGPGHVLAFDDLVGGIAILDDGVLRDRAQRDGLERALADRHGEIDTHQLREFCRSHPGPVHPIPKAMADSFESQTVRCRTDHIAEEPSSSLLRDRPVEG
jgi:hypothetical protein